jgi:hypothetical protein
MEDEEEKIHVKLEEKARVGHKEEVIVGRRSLEKKFARRRAPLVEVL